MKLVFALIFFSFTLLMSCGTSRININHLRVFEKGMPKAQVKELILLVPPEKEFTISINEKEYQVMVIPLLVGTKMLSFNFPIPIGGYWNVTTTSALVSQTDYCIFIFTEGKLRYWGMKNDYSKSEDIEISTLSPKLYEAFSLFEEEIRSGEYLKGKRRKESN